MIRFVILTICIVACPLWSGGAYSQIIPQSRITSWQGSGVAGGIPNRTNVVDCVNDSYAGKGSFYLRQEADNRPAISACINSLSANQVAYLPPGDYRMDSELVITRSNTTLRGAGPGRTVLNFHGGNYAYIQFTGLSTFDPPPFVQSWTAGYAKGTSVITLNSVKGLKPGDVIVLDQLDDNSGVSFTNGDWGTQFTRDGNKRHLSQTAAVKAISGNQVTLDTPLHIGYSPSLAPQVYWWHVTISDSGVEDLSISTNSDPGPTFPEYNIFIQYAQDVWVRNVESAVAPRAHVRTFRTHRVEIRDSYFHHSRSYGSSSYGIEIWNTSASLIENNVLDTLTAPILLAVGASGNVIGYNYIHSVRYDPSPNWLPETMSAHAGHDLMNLFEGNIAPNLYLDNTWGSNSHTTAFRNRIKGWQAGRSLNTHAFSMEAHSRSNNIVGNIIGTEGYHKTYQSPIGGAYYGSDALYKMGYWTTDGGSLTNYDTAVYGTLLRHANYDTVNDRVLYCDTDGGSGCQGGNASRTLPDSLYLTSKPAWFGGCTWPPFEPIGAVENDLPAKLRFEGGSCATSTVAPPPPPAPAVTFTATPSTVALLESSTLAWLVSNATSAVIDQGIGSVDPSAGVVVVTPQATTTYTITATGAGGTLTGTATVSVIAPLAPTLTLTVSPSAITAGEATTLGWAATDATSVVIDNGIGTMNASGGTLALTPQVSTTYRATATGPGGSVSRSVSISVTPVNQPAEMTLLSAPPGGGDIVEAPGEEASASLLGHGRIFNDGASASSVAMVRLVQNGVLVSETAIPASVERRAGILPVEMVNPPRWRRSTAVKTFLAITNQTAEEAVITYRFNNPDGTVFGLDNVVVAPNTQMTAFLDATPFSAPANWEGAFEFSSSVPIGVSALRTVVNKRGDFLFTNVAVTSREAPGGSQSPAGTAMLPFFVAGGNWTTRLVLTNGTAEVQRGTIEFLDQGAATSGASPVAVSVNGVRGSTVGYALQPFTVAYFTLGAASDPARDGSVRVVANGSTVPAVSGVLSYNHNGSPASMVSLTDGDVGSSLRTYIELSGGPTATGSVETLLRITNASRQNNVVWMDVFRMDGTRLGRSKSVTLSPSGQAGGYLSNLFSEIPDGFKGIVRISAQSPVGIFAARTRINKRGERIMAATPPLIDSGASPAAGDVVFPFLLSGGGYATEFIVLAQADEALSAGLALTAQDGSQFAPE